jgi:hypothetical protein
MQQNQPNTASVLPYAVPRPPRPFWVKVGLWGVPGRRAAWGFFWVCIAFAAFSGMRGFRDARWFLGTPVVLAAFWYWASIRWTDRHGSWTHAAVGRDGTPPAA